LFEISKDFTILSACEGVEENRLVVGPVPHIEFVLGENDGHPLQPLVEGVVVLGQHDLFVLLAGEVVVVDPHLEHALDEDGYVQLHCLELGEAAVSVQIAFLQGERIRQDAQTGQQVHQHALVVNNVCYCLQLGEHDLLIED